MATFDQLTADQRAIVELVLQRGKSYHELSDLLAMPEARVRELARDALVTLTPVTAEQVEADWRGQLADYVLGQQTGPEATATKGHLRRSEAARTFARSLLDSLDTLYTNGIPAVPEAERAGGRERPVVERLPRRQDRERESAAEPDSPVTPRPLSAEARDAVKRRRLMAGGAGAALILVAVLLWPIGLLTGSDDNKKSTASGGTSTTQAAGNAQGPAGIAVVAQRNGQRQVIVQATLTPTKQRQAYEVWLYNSRTDAKSLGAQVTDSKGTYQGAGPLPTDFAKYKYIDVSLEPIDQNRGHSGKSILRGAVPKLSAPPANPKKNQASILGQTRLTPVSG